MSAASSPDSPIYELRRNSPSNTLFYDSASPASSLSPRNTYDDDETFISGEELTDDSDDDVVGGSANKRNKTSKPDLGVVKKAKRGRPKGKSMKKKKSSAKSSPTPAFVAPVVAPALSINSNNLLSRNQRLASTSPTSYINALSNSNLDQINFTSPVRGSTNDGPAPIISELATRLPAIFHGMRMEATQGNLIIRHHLPIWTDALRSTMDSHESSGGLSGRCGGVDRPITHSCSSYSSVLGDESIFSFRSFTFGRRPCVSRHFRQSHSLHL